MRILIFGSGQYYQIYKHCFVGTKIVALLDNDKGKIGQSIDGIPIMSPRKGILLDFDAVFILSSRYADKMKMQLEELGVKKDIYTYTGADLIKALKDVAIKQPLKIFVPDECYGRLIYHEKPRIALLTHDLSMGGANICLLDVARILIKFDYEVHVISMRDGDLKKEYLQHDIPVIIDANIYFETLDDIQWKSIYNLIVANTIHFYHIFLRNSSNIPVIWWLHDSEMIYGAHKVERLNVVARNNISVYAVSKMAEIPFKCRCSEWTVERLLYGKNDFYWKGNCEDFEENIVFAIIGGCSPRKGHDVFLDAIALLPKAKCGKCKFWIVGDNQSSFGKIILERVKNYLNVKMWGIVDHDTLQYIYHKISVLVCPSLEDAMPGVCTEAMMWHRPCIVSDHTGTADYIIPEGNGLICKAGDALDLAIKMEWMIDHASLISVMGNAAREVYEANFSMKKFEEKILHIVEKKIEQN